MMEHFTDFLNYKKERTSIVINYNARKGSALYFKDTKLKNLKNKTINSIIQQINSFENKNEYFDLMNIILKELSYRSLINNTSIKSNNKTHSIVNLFNIAIDFYYYEFVDDKFYTSDIKTVTVSLIQKNKWYNYYILINNTYTGIDLNFVSIASVQGYSSRKQIGLAYLNYVLNNIPIEDSLINKNNKTAKIPIKCENLFNTVLNNNVYKIHKFSNRDELTELNLI
jgi:hypothetical protein